MAGQVNVCVVGDEWDQVDLAYRSSTPGAGHLFVEEWDVRVEAGNVLAIHEAQAWCIS